MTQADLVIAGGTVAAPTSVGPADVVVSGERIAAVVPAGTVPAARRIDACGLIVLPGGVDVHTHLLIGFMGRRSVYDFFTGSVAALRGGTTTIMDFALQRRGRSLMDGIRHRRSQADGHVAVDYGLHGIVTDVNPRTLGEIEAAVEAGVTSFKVYMVYEKEQLLVPDGALRALLHAAARAGAIVGVHAENAGIIDFETARCLAAGQRAPRFHAVTRPPIAEAEAISRSLMLAEEAGAPLYVFHLAVGAGVDLVREARRRGVRAFAETCPHYLTLTDAAYERPDAHLYVMSPPLRSADDQARLWEGLADRTLVAVASDDASYDAEAKALGTGSFDAIANGVPGVETRLPLLYTFGVKQGRLSLRQLAEVWSEGPARLFGLTPRKGAITPGADADLVLIDPARRERLSAASHYGAVGYSPYDGIEVTGIPVLTLRRGRVVVDRGRFLGEEGQGEFLPRARPVLDLS